MRIWDVAAGYLSRQSLLGEHRELHGLYNIHCHSRAGYSHHPETRRWTGCLSGLRARHAQLVAEMSLRGYIDRTPLRRVTQGGRWPAVFIDPPAAQFERLRGKYAGQVSGRIPLPQSAHDLWAQHKYSVLARDPAAYREIGRRVSRARRGTSTADLALELTLFLRLPPPEGRAANAIEHMWGYVARHADARTAARAARSPGSMLSYTQRLAVACREPYLLASTALSELAAAMRAS